MTGLFDVDTKMTLGASINVKHINYDDKNIILQIWDFGGEEQFRFLLPVYAYGSSAAIFMYDISRYDTIKNIDQWINTFLSDFSEEEKQLPIMMVGGKLDLKKKRSVSKKDAQAISEAHNFVEYIECSAKTGKNVGNIFENLIIKILERADLL